MQKIHAALLAAVAGCALAASPMQAGAQENSGLYVFGDSLSDPGNIPRLGGPQTPPAPYVGFRFSNGPVYAEYLQALLGIPTVQNNAIGGATTGRVNNTVPNLPGVAGQIDRYLAARPRADSRDLFIVFAGPNDAFTTLGQAAVTPPAQIPALIQASVTAAITNTLDSLGRLTASGGSQFIVPNLPDLGRTASAIASGPQGQALASAYSTAFNGALAGILAQRAESVRIIPFDTAAVFADVIANPARYGLTNTTQACIRVAACIGASVATQNTFLFFDDIHPTSGVHQTLGYMMAHVVAAPGVFAAMDEVGVAGRRNLQAQLTPSPNSDAGGGAPVTATQIAGAVGHGTLRLSGSYGSGSRDAIAGRRGFDYDTRSAVVGLDWRLTENWTAGAAVGVGRGDADLDLSAGKVKWRGVMFGGYASYVAGGFAATASIDHVRDKFDKVRRPVGVLDLVTEGDTSGSTTSISLDTQYAFSLGDLQVGPIAGLRWSRGRIDGYSETGLSFLAMDVEKQGDLKRTTGRAGVFAGYPLAVGREATLRATAVVTGEHEFQDLGRELTTRLHSQPTIPIRTQIGSYEDTYGRAGIGLELVTVSRLTASLGASTTFGRDDGHDWTVGARIGVRF